MISLKKQISDYWDNNPCGECTSGAIPGTWQWAVETDRYRYSMIQFLAGFADWDNTHNQRILEIGVGIGCDFNQFADNQNYMYGIDATPQAIELTKKRLSVCRNHAIELTVADAENLPYPDESFDIVYSWGVLHHTPDTKKAIEEAVRVCCRGGKIKLMLYNSDCLFTYLFWAYNNLKHFPKGRKRSLWEDFESIGTKAFTKSETEKMIPNTTRIIKMDCPVSGYELMLEKPAILQFIMRTIYRTMEVIGVKEPGFYRCLEMEKV